MLTLLGYILPSWFALIGLSGLVRGVWPGITIVARHGLRMKLASILLIAPLPICIVWGYRETESDRVIGALDQQIETAFGTFRRVLDDPHAIEHPLHQSQVAEELALRTQVGEEVIRVQNRLEELDVFELAFDRISFCLFGLLIAYLLLPRMPNPMISRDHSTTQPTDSPA